MNVFEQLRDLGDKAPQLYVIATGAGAGLQRRIWDIPGISNFFVGASFPYATEETDSLLGFKPEKYVSEYTAIDLATTAYMKAWKPGKKAIGLGMTCSVTSLKAHRGDHRIIAAIVGDDGCCVLSVVIPKLQAIDRWKDGLLADLLGEEFINFYINKTWDNLKFDDCKVQMAVADGMATDRIMAHPLFKPDGSRATLQDISPNKTIFFPGAFNPPHAGHFEGAQAAVQTKLINSGKICRLIFSTTINPPHKPALSNVEMLQRAKLMRGNDFLLTSDDPLFINKARKFPGATFVMGADTMRRFLDCKWGEPIEPMLQEFNTLETRFVVLGRLVDGRYTVASDFYGNLVPVRYIHLFNEVNFRLDISSTELRENDFGA